VQVLSKTINGECAFLNDLVPHFLPGMCIYVCVRAKENGHEIWYVECKKSV
jgi:hypothetical protein